MHNLQVIPAVKAVTAAVVTGAVVTREVTGAVTREAMEAVVTQEVMVAVLVANPATVDKAVTVAVIPVTEEVMEVKK